MSTLNRHIAVVSINRDKYSETFIHDSFDYFAGRKSLLYGGYLPTHVTTDWRKEGTAIPIARPPFWKRIPKNEEARRAYSLTKWLQKNRPDVVLVHYGPSGVMMAPICKALRIPLVVHFHGYDAYRADILQEQGLHYPALFAVAAQLVVPSADMQQQLLKLGCQQEKISVLPYGADLKVFEWQPLPPIGTPFRFVFVGRLVPKKAPDLLIRAFSHVRRQLPHAELVIVGDGELADECRNLVQQLNLQAAVQFLGILAPQHVAQVIGASHSLVLPSRQTADGDSEGTPVVIMEAGAVGRPVIASTHAGIPNVIHDRNTGLLVPQGDEAALVEAMLRLSQDAHLHATMSKLARERIAQHFSQSGYHSRLWELLENACIQPRNS